MRARSLNIAAIDPPFSLTRNWQALQPQPASNKCQLHDSDKNIATTITPQQKTYILAGPRKTFPYVKIWGPTNKYRGETRGAPGGIINPAE